MVVSAQHFSDMVNGYERTTSGLWTHKGKLVVVGGPVSLPTGSITTEEIAPSATQQLVGNFSQYVTWTLPNTNVWTETPIQLTLTMSGVPARIEFNVPLSCATKGQHLAWGIMLNGAPPPAALGAIDAPDAGFGMMGVGIYYVQPSAGSGRIGFGLYGPSGSQVAGGLPSTLYVTEQKR